ncbi:MAG: segregation and condensation protein B [Chlamydiales bacterium]|jgi:segregation and condensation protein B
MNDSPEPAVQEPGQDPDVPETSEVVEAAEVAELIDAPEGDDAGVAPEAAVDEAQNEDEDEDDTAPLEDSATDEELVAHVSALLFACPDPIGAARLAKVLGTSKARVKTAMTLVGERLNAAGLGFELRGLAGGSTLMTRPALGELVASLSKQATVERISPAALETLSVVAYRGPVTKAEIEAIRGVQAGPMLRSLVDRGLVRVVGRSEDPGHALMYGTTKEFLFRFGLETLADLPRDGELARN